MSILRSLPAAATAAMLLAGLPASADTATIDPDAQQLTMINILTPSDAAQDQVVAQLQDALSTTLAETPGFISGSVHRSLDSNHVAVYAQWKDQASLEAFVSRLESGDAPAMATVFSMATPDYHPYAVTGVYRGQD